MAKVHKNVLIEGLRGTIGDTLVFKHTRSGRTILAKKPEFPKHRKFSPAQKAHQARFREAVAYARAAQTQPIYITLAKKRNLTAYSVALADAMHPPRVLAIDASGYTGRAGGLIRVQAEDDVQVARVHVTLRNADDQVLEEGEAVSDRAGRWWTYTTQVNDKGATISVTAYDLPGNAAELEMGG